MIHNMLLGELPKTVEIDGDIHEIDFGYRAGILIELNMFSDRDDRQKILDSLNIFYKKNIPGDEEQAIDKMLEFYRRGEPEQKPGKKAGKRKATERAYDFDTDAGRIYAAFRQIYGIDLTETPNKELHFWKFMELFENLPEKTTIQRVMYYRTADTSKMGKNQKAFIKRMREIYRIEKTPQSMTDAANLAKRNADMKEYVRKRVRECSQKE